MKDFHTVFHMGWAHNLITQTQVDPVLRVDALQQTPLIDMLHTFTHLHMQHVQLRGRSTFEKLEQLFLCKQTQTQFQFQKVMSKKMQICKRWLQ